MRKLLHKVRVPILIVAVIFAVYLVAIWLGYVPYSLALWVLYVAIPMALGLLVYFVRTLFWGEVSWDEAMGFAWLLVMAVFFFVGFPFGACILISGFFVEKISPLACLGVGVVVGVVVLVFTLGWLQWITPWLESRPQKVKGLCPACKSKKLMLVSVPREDNLARYPYRCFDCEWEGSAYEVWPELVKDQNKNK